MQRYLQNTSIALTVLFVPLLLAGCPSPRPGNQAPVARAGADQSVKPGDTVTLNGLGSSDPDGDAITIAWKQTVGTAVTLTNADKIAATFTAPAQSGLLTFELTVSDGLLSATDTVNVGVDTGVVISSALFIANFTSANVTVYDISNTDNLDGDKAPSANLAGDKTLLGSPSDVVIGAGGTVLTANFSSKSITTHVTAGELSGINGDFAPVRNVQGAATTIEYLTSMAIQPSSDLLFVSDLTPGRILVFSNASGPSFNGNTAPIRTFSSKDAPTPAGINFGAGDTLYVANAKTIAVFDNASTLSGEVIASRVISSAAFSSLYDVCVDVGNDRMFVVDYDAEQVHIFNNASTRSGAIVPDKTLTVSGAVSLTAIAVDRTGIGYIVDYGNGAVYSYDNIGTRSGTIAPDRILKGNTTKLLNPIRLFLLE